MKGRTAGKTKSRMPTSDTTEIARRRVDIRHPICHKMKLYPFFTTAITTAATAPAPSTAKSHIHHNPPPSSEPPVGDGDGSAPAERPGKNPKKPQP